MPTVVRFGDSKLECWSRVNFENGDPIYISIARSGIIVKRSRMGLFGPLLYSEKNIYNISETAQYLDMLITKYTTPDNMTNPILKAFTQTALDSLSIAKFTITMNTVKKLYKEQNEQS